MIRLVGWGAVGLLAAGAGCGVNSGAAPPAAFGDPLVTTRCSRTYHNDTYGFGLTPPDGSQGPDQSSTSKDARTLMIARWTTPTGRILTATVFNIGTTTFDSAVGGVRTYSALQGLTVLDDNPIALDSGRVGWLIKTGSPGGATTISVFDTRRGYFFALDVDVSGITTSELDIVNRALLSFCIDS